MPRPGPNIVRNLVGLGIAAMATAGVLRPFAWPEFIWAITGAVLLIVLNLLPAAEALAAVARGTDVYLFLIGMMLLAEVARKEGLFDWLAAEAAKLARGSATRLFSLVFGVGTIVTVFLSNDATAVVLDPSGRRRGQGGKSGRSAALFAHLRLHRQRRQLRPADLEPGEPGDLRQFTCRSSLDWLRSFALPSLLSVLATYALLRWSQRSLLRQPLSTVIAVPDLTAAGKLSAIGIAATAVVLLDIFRVRSPARTADLPVWRGDRRLGADAVAGASDGSNPRHLLGHPAAGGRPVCARPSASGHRCDGQSGRAAARWG